ncbi:MAG TPA: SHOCT domain-containing protein [Candidatus Saccharibacteria bacterium]|nr:SHOCT domain-containing protein [Candidatus Saccharibacteria bacterium]
MLIVVALLVVGVALVVRSLNNQNQAGRSSQDDAMSILKKRYAAGDIDKKEFEEKKKALTE